MAAVNYYFRGKKDTGNLTVRFIHTRYLDIKSTTPIVIPKKSWDQKKQRVKNIGTSYTAAKINEKLLELENTIIAKFSLDNIEGKDFDSIWLKKTVLTFFNRPTYEAEQRKKDERKIYFTSFCDHFFQTIINTGKWKNTKTNKPLAYKSVQHYKLTVEILQEYEKEFKTRIKHRDLNLDFCEKFVDFLRKGTKERKGFTGDYPSKIIGRVKFYCRRAEEDNIEINKVYKSKMFTASAEETIDPYLNEEEIEILFNHDFSSNPRLDNVRDWLIIGCHTGLRVCDFLGDAKWPGLSKDKIEGGIIHLTTRKTGKTTAIPLHSKIKSILAKREGDFPHKITSQSFNKYVKEVCEAVGFDQLIMASIKDPETNRKVKKLYPKHQAISSHVCRRSFATNHYGKIRTSLIMAIGAWKTETSFLKYLKKSNVETAQELQDFWDKEELRKIK